MPESKGRKKQEYVAPTMGPQELPASPRWFAPVMVGLMVFGLLWTVVFYLNTSGYPIPGIGNWNLTIGFSFILVGFVMSTRWR